MAKKKRKRPGPPKTKGKDRIRSLRVPDEEWDSWKKKAASEGLTLSRWLRILANKAAAKN